MKKQLLLLLIFSISLYVQGQYLQLVITQYFVSCKSEIWA